MHRSDKHPEMMHPRGREQLIEKRKACSVNTTYRQFRCGISCIRSSMTRLYCCSQGSYRTTKYLCFTSSGMSRDTAILHIVKFTRLSCYRGQSQVRWVTFSHFHKHTIGSMHTIGSTAPRRRGRFVGSDFRNLDSSSRHVLQSYLQA